MKRIFVFVTVLFFLQLAAHAQNVDKQLFESICQNIVKQNDYLLLRKKLTGVSIVTDPVSGNQTIKYLEAADNRAVEQFKKYSRQDQIAILNAEALPVFPLNDTILIVDTLRFFSEGISYAIDGYLFKVVRKAKDRSGSFPYLYATGVRDNNLIFSFSFANSKLLSNYYFNLKAKSFSVYKTTILEVNSSTE